MKKLIVMLAIVCSCKMASAQIVIAILFGDKLNTGKMEFGLAVSPSFTDISNIEAKNKHNLNLGIYFNFRPDKKIFLHVEGVAKAGFGARKIAPYPTGSDTLDALFENGSVTRRIRAFSLPILVRYTLAPKFFAEAGIQADMMLGAKDIYEYEKDDKVLNYTVKVGDQVSLLDFGFAAGLHYNFSKQKGSMGLGIRYFQGVTDILPKLDGNQVNNAWQINVTIPIGTGKSQAAATNSSTGKK